MAYALGLKRARTDVKRGGLGGHHSKMLDVGRVERLWLAMAVAMLWMIVVGSHADSQWDGHPFPQAPAARAPSHFRRLACPQALSPTR
jgi:hypothetical protein